MNMKKMILTGMLVGTLVMSGILTGCTTLDTPKSKNPQSVSMVMGVHDYFPVISLDTNAVYSKIYDACYTYGDFSAVVVDGDPFVACNYNINEPEKKIDSAKKKQIASKNAAQIMSEVSAVSAKTPEIDTLSAISLSADSLHSVPGESEKSMIVFDSGLSTTSLLNFSAQNIIDEPVESLVAQLEKLHAIPDLTGIDVTWVGLGATCGEQDNLTNSYKFKLKTIWEGILTAGGASSITFDQSPTSSEEYAMDLPKCSTVPIVADCLEVAELVTEEEMPEVIKWDGNSSLQFESDKAEFIDTAAAMAELGPIAEYLNANPNEAIYIFGMTATVAGGDSGVGLSEERAQACKNVLLEKGVNEAQVTCVGLGQTQNSLRAVDIDESGMQNENAQKNRAVFVVKAESELVDVLVNSVHNIV